MLVYLIHRECSHGMTNRRSVKALIIGDTPGAILSTGGKKSVEQIDRVGLNTFQTCFTQRLDKISA